MFFCCNVSFLVKIIKVSHAELLQSFRSGGPSSQSTYNLSASQDEPDDSEDVVSTETPYERAIKEYVHIHLLETPIMLT